MSKYFEVDTLQSSRFFDLMFFCWQQRLPFLGAMYFGEYFVVNDSVRPGQDVKWLRLVTQINIDLIGLKSAPIYGNYLFSVTIK